MEKEFSVAFISKSLKKEYDSLKCGKYEQKELYRFICRAIDDLKSNPSCGVKIPNKLWPRVYSNSYNISNLWKYDLPNAWRVIYTIKTNEVSIIGFILEWLSHKEYERRFNYRKA